MGEEFEREWVHVYVWPGPSAVQLKLVRCCLLISCTPIPNKVLKKKKEFLFRVFLCFDITSLKKAPWQHRPQNSQWTCYTASTHVHEDSSMERVTAAWAQVLILRRYRILVGVASFPISRVSSFPGDIKVCAAQMLKLFLPPFECPNRIVASVTNYVVCVCVCVCVSVRERVQSCPTLCDPIDGVTP